MKIHQFASTKEAYDETQCSLDVKSGDILLIPRENVVGVAYVWPFSITTKHGALHSLVEGTVFEGKDAHLNASIEEAKKHIYPTAEDINYIMVLNKFPYGERYLVSCFVNTKSFDLGCIELEDNGSWVIDPYVANFGNIVSFQSYESAMNALITHFKTIKDGVVWMLSKEE